MNEFCDPSAMLDWLVNRMIALGKQAVSVNRKLALGNGATRIFLCLTELLQPLLVVTVNETVYGPASAKVWVKAADVFLTTGAVPSPKSQVQVVNAPTGADDESVKVTVCVSQAGALKPKLATGGTRILMVLFAESTQP